VIDRISAHRSVRFGPFSLDLTTAELRRHDRKIRLQDQPFKMLLLLIERAGDVVTRDDIRQRLWANDTTVVFDASVATVLKKLRQALGDEAGRPRYIETLPRRGYRWLAPVAWDEVSTGSPVGPRLVGRAAPLAALRESLRAARGGERQIVLITGEPGMGKTALITAFEREVAGTVRSARGQCVEEYGTTEPYYAVLDAIGELCRGPHARPVLAALAAHAPTWLVQFPALVTAQQRTALQREIQGVTRLRMLREICDALEAIATEQPLLLVLEDLHWGDPWTIDLLAAIARRRARTPLMIVGTYRPAESAAALDATANDLLVHGLAKDIRLQPLTESDLAAYLSSAPSGAPPSADLARVVHRHSEGNPLFMVAALDHLERLGLIARAGGTFEPTVALDQVDIGVPDTLRQLIEVQIDRLSHDEQEALEVASVAGASFLASVCAAVLDVNLDACERWYESLSKRDYIIRRASGPQASSGATLSRYEFVHAVYREVLYQRLPDGRRGRLHGRAGDELERLRELRALDGADVVPELVRHFEASGDWRRAAKYLALMAETAGRSGVPRDATALLQRALDLVARLPDADRATLELELLHKLAVAYVVSFDARAVETYDRLIARAAQHGSIMGEIRGLIGIAYPVSWVSASRCLDAVQRALTLSETLTDPLQRARVQASCLVRRIWAGGWNAQDAAECRRALAVIRATGDRRMLAKHLVDCNYLHWASSEYRIARQEAVESLAILQDVDRDDPYLSFPYWLNQFILPWSLLYLGEWGEMLRELEDGIANAQKNGDEFRAQTLRLYQAELHLHAMDFTGVLSLCAPILPVLDRPERTPWRRFCLALIGSAHVALGQLPQALDHLTTLRTEMARHTVIHDGYTGMMLELALTDQSLATRDLSTARTHANELLEATRSTAERTWQALAWEASARVANADGDAERAQACIDRALAAMEGFETPLAAWRAHATAAGLMPRADRVEEAARHHELARSMVSTLANSLPPDHPLRATFLAAVLRRLESPFVDPERLDSRFERR
jgi:DNA-binding winged helix-turn-helix (wHTH) protein/tetratricopeptide (TPR) repeat protein